MRHRLTMRVPLPRASGALQCTRRPDEPPSPLYAARLLGLRVGWRRVGTL
jgi:hypothetical protein